MRFASYLIVKFSRRRPRPLFIQNDLHRPPPSPGPRLRRPIGLRGRRRRHVLPDHDAGVRLLLFEAIDGHAGDRAGLQLADRVGAVPRRRNRRRAGGGDGPAEEEPGAAGEAGQERQLQGQGGADGADRQHCWRRWRVEQRRVGLACAVRG